MQYENVFNMIGGVHIILAFLVLLLLLLKLVGRRRAAKLRRTISISALWG